MKKVALFVNGFVFFCIDVSQLRSPLNQSLFPNGLFPGNGHFNLIKTASAYGSL
jgi:hypothetical protein